MDETYYPETTTFRDLYMQRSQPQPRDGTIQVTIYGYPVTLDRFPGKHGHWTFRVAAWATDNDVMKTRPLVEERFDEDVFHETAYEYAKKANLRMMPPGTGVTESFMVEWVAKNRRTIEEAANRRAGNLVSYADADTSTPPIRTRTFTGEDGKTYHELDLRGEDTDPVLLNALRDREHALIAQAERKRLADLEIEARRARVQDALEAMPGWASF